MRLLTDFGRSFFFWIWLKTGAFSAFLQACLKKLLKIAQNKGLWKPPLAQNRGFFSLFASLPEKIAQNKGFWGSWRPPLGLLWAFCKLLRYFQPFLGLGASLFCAGASSRLFLGFWTSSQPFLGLRFSRASGLFWAFCGLLHRTFDGLSTDFCATFGRVFFFFDLKPKQRLFQPFCKPA